MTDIEPSSAYSVTVQSAYRTTCDNCMRSKVRCSKDHPSCHRCLGQGVACIYSQSRRSKKIIEYRDVTQQARSAGDSIADDSNIGSPSPSNSREQSAATNLRDDYVSPSNVFSSTHDQEYPSPWSLFYNDCEVQESAAIGLDGVEAFERMEGMEGMDGLTRPDTGHNEISQDQVMGLSSYQWSTDPSTEEALIPVTPNTSPDFISSIFSCSEDSPGSSLFDKSHGTSTTSIIDSLEDGNGKPGCAWIAASIMKSLESPGTPLEDKSQPSFAYGRLCRNLDTVISTNKAAIKHLHRISGCTCSIPGNHFVLISAVLFMVLAWYEACLDACNRASEQGAVRPGSRDSTFEMDAGNIEVKEDRDAGSDERSMLVYIPPIQVGSLQLGAESRRQVVAQIVLTELAKVTRVIETLTERSCGVNGHQELEAQLQLSLRAALQNRIEKISQGAERVSK